ncbi:hypothetical protein ACF1G0_09920 [Streptomyces sp. NPDC013953]|uniref:hypothetical protein n=1 Tax=Streptomyces sp. NPDC013953 TaxID=3364868 RepID=UPI003700033D
MTASPEAAVLTRVAELFRDAPADRGGALWRLAADGRQLDANVVRLGPDARVAVHVEPDLDVLLYVVDGTGRLDPGDGDGQGERELGAGAVVWLPRGARRGVVAGAAGLAYLTVHRRRPGLSIRSAPASPAAVAEGDTRARATGSGAGGEPVCLLNRVCPECGRLAPDESDVRFCGRCGSRLPSD